MNAKRNGQDSWIRVKFKNRHLYSSLFKGVARQWVIRNARARSLLEEQCINMNFTPSARGLLFDQLCDMHGMEVQLLKAMPRLAALSHHPALRSHILGWREDIDVQCVEISEIFARAQLSPGTSQCMAMMCIIEWGETDLEAVKNFPLRDLMVAAHCLRISHYVIAACEITGRLAERLGAMREAGILAMMREREMQAADDLRELELEIFHIASESTYETAAR